MTDENSNPEDPATGFETGSVGSADAPEPSPDTSAAFDRAAEVDAICAEDTTLLGRYWGYLQQGLTREEMVEAEGGANIAWTYNYAFLLENLRTGRIPESPSGARSTGARIRSWLRSKPMSDELRQALIEQESVVSALADDPQRQAAEVETAVKATVQAEASGQPGIYVYTLPHYMRHPIDDETGKTLLKVGHSAVDAFYRASSQGRLTALPEDPILLRIYPVETSAAAEREFHAWLRDADHLNSRTRRGGSEWFVTSTKFLDRVARNIGLDVVVVNDFEIGGN